MKPHFLPVLLLLLLLSACRTHIVHKPQKQVRKPVIYLYPEKTQDVSVTIETQMQLTVTNPVYNGEWNVVAHPGGSIFNPADGKTYPYLFWEAEDDHAYAFEKGFCVKGDSTRVFLEKMLPQIGLLPAEYDEFITFWEPFMKGNAYNVITFAQEEYTDRAKLHITPAPDKLLRVFMVFKAADAPVSISPQAFPPFERKGFTVVEWGGTDVSEKQPLE